MRPSHPSTLIVRCLGQTAPVQFAAQELARHLGRMAGTTVPVETAAAAPPGDGVWVGEASAFGGALARQLRSAHPFDDRVFVDAGRGRAVVSGANPRSVLLAAYRYIEELGCRWFRPGPDGERVPRLTRPLARCVRLDERPSARHRVICIEGACSEEHVIDMADYAAAHPSEGLIHVWQADGMNNQCECAGCRGARPSDWYVELLNEIDRRLAARKLATRIVFLAYVDLLWGPARARLRNPGRFILMFAPITRSFSRAFLDRAQGRGETVGPYRRNRLVYPRSPQANLKLLRGWTRWFRGDCVDFDYHLWWDWRNDPGQLQLARVLHADVVNLRRLGMRGFISCQNQRPFFPTGIWQEAMARGLWDAQVPFAAVVRDYLAALFGPRWRHARGYLADISRLFDPPFLRGERKGAAAEAAALRRLSAVPSAVARLRPHVVAGRRRLCRLVHVRRASARSAAAGNRPLQRYAHLWRVGRSDLRRLLLAHGAFGPTRAARDLFARADAGVGCHRTEADLPKDIGHQSGRQAAPDRHVLSGPPAVRLRVDLKRRQKMSPVILITALGMVLAAGTHVSLAAGESLATIECRERLGRNWPRTMVTYYVQESGARNQKAEGVPAEISPARITITGHVRPEHLRLLDAAGASVPFQLWETKKDKNGFLVGTRLSFMGELAKSSNYVYRLVAGDAAPAADAGVSVSGKADSLELDNGITAVRLPPSGTVTFEKPLSFGVGHQAMIKLYGRQAANGIAPGPFQGIRLSDGRWAGGSYFQAEDPARAPHVLGYACGVTEQGPIFTEARIRYVFDGDRYYQMTVRMLPGDPAIRVDEQFDMKRIGSTRDWRVYSSNDWQVVMSLTGGWQPNGWKPDSAFWERYSYGSALITQTIPLEPKLKELGFEFLSPDYGTHKVVYGDLSTVIFGVEPWCPWGAFAGYFGLVEGSRVDRLDNTPFLAVVPMHAGSWRMDGPYNWKKFVGHKDDAALHWPLDVFRHPNVITHTGEYDTQLPWTFGRRIWALVGGPLQTFKSLHALRNYEGYISLDNYKDWLLDWPDDPKVTYPRVFFDAADVKKIKPDLDRHPAAELLKTALYFNDDAKRRTNLWDRLTGLYGLFGFHNYMEPDVSYYFTLFRQGHSTEEWVAPMDELLSSPTLTAEQRRTLKRKIAAFCYLASEPDFNPRGTMSHLGNPNMPINRFLALPFAAALIPDHPRAADWMDVSDRYVRYKLAANVAPGGAWSELFTYYDASAPALIHAANILRNAGRGSDSMVDLAVKTGLFPLHFLSPPDPRFGVRLMPCWGHEGRESFGQWLPVAGLMRTTHPETARETVWAWNQLGRLAGFHDGPFNRSCVLFADALAGAPPGYAAPGLASAWYPGVGAALRAHAGDSNETYLSYRQGYMVSHCDNNQGDFILHAKGAPLIDMSLFAYTLHQNDMVATLNQTFGYYSVPRFGTRDNVSDVRKGSNQTDKPGDWNPSSAIHAHRLGESVDYLRGHSDNQGRRWTRQIVFFKGKAAAGPNYFIFRDSTDSLNGDPKALVPYWWNFKTVGSKSQVAAGANEVNYTSAYGPRLNVRFLQPASIQAETRDVSRDGQTLKHASRWESETPVIRPNQPNWTKVAEVLSVTSVGPIDAGHDALVALYPQGPNEAAPRYESLADGAARITTSEGTDYIFVDRKPMTYKADDVEFSGKCGAVRIYPDEVHMVIAEGPGEIRCQGLTLRSPKPVTRVFLKTELTKTRTIEEMADKTSLRIRTPRGDREEWAPGVVYTKTKHGYSLTVDASAPVAIVTNGMVFTGKRGSLELDTSEKTVRLVMLEGEALGCNGALAWGANGPYEVVFSPDRIEGRSEGQGRFLCVSQPAGIDKMASLEIDGQPYAPGTANTIDPAIAGRTQGPDSMPTRGGTLVVPLMPGSHAFKVKNLDQPPVWRNWQAW